MTWTNVLENWTAATDRLAADFPHLERQALTRFRGDSAKLITYLAETHDLTPAEARSTLLDRVAFRALPDATARAA